MRLDLHALHDVRWLRLHLRVRGHELHFNFLALAKEALNGHSKRNDNRQKYKNHNDSAHREVHVNMTIILLTELGHVAV